MNAPVCSETNHTHIHTPTHHTCYHPPPPTSDRGHTHTLAHQTHGTTPHERPKGTRTNHHTRRRDPPSLPTHPHTDLHILLHVIARVLARVPPDGAALGVEQELLKVERDAGDLCVCFWVVVVVVGGGGVLQSVSAYIHRCMHA